MKRVLVISVLIFGFAGTGSLLAQSESAEGNQLTLKINPYVDHELTLNLSKLGKDSAGQSQDAFRQKDGFAGAEFYFGYGDLVDVLLDIRYNVGNENDFDDILEQTYVGVHALDALFGVEQKVFDAYIKAGLFDAELDNARHAGQDDFLADVDSLDFHQGVTDAKALLGNRLVPNLQLSLKLLDMLTLSGVFRLDDWHNIPFKQEHAKAGTTFANLTVSHNTVTDPQVIYDFGASILFEKTFTDTYKMEASAAYLVDLSPEKGSNPNMAFDQLGLTFSNTFTVPGIMGYTSYTPFGNFKLKNVFMDVPGRGKGIEFAWSAGFEFSWFVDLSVAGREEKKIEYFKIGIDVFGNGNTTGAATYQAGKVRKPYAPFQGFGITTYTDVVGSLIGADFLAFTSKTLFEFGSDSANNIERKYKRTFLEYCLIFDLIDDGKDLLSLLLGYRAEAVDKLDGNIYKLADENKTSLVLGVNMALSFDVDL